MSPEQAEGKKVDARSDIFSFGAVLYEMVTGQRAFQGENRVSTLAAILHKEPAPISEAASDPVLPELQKVIARCLRKDPQRRIQHLDDVKLALEELQESASGTHAQPPAARAPARRRWVWAALLPLLLIAAFLAWRTWRAPENEALRAVPLTTHPGVHGYPSFSPDGNHVAFSWSGLKQDNPDIYVQQIGSGSPLRLTNDPGKDYNPVWSPNGRSIAFLRSQAEAGNSELRLIPPLGGPERKLADLRVRGGIFVSPPYLAWCPDSNCLVVTDSPGEGKPDSLSVISLETGEKRQLTKPQSPAAADTNPAVSPDGSWLVFRRMAGLYNSEIYRLPLERGPIAVGEPQRLTSAAMDAHHPTWMPDSKEILFSAKGGLWRVLVAGESQPARLPFVGEDGTMPVVSRPQPGQSPRLVYVRSFQDLNIWRVQISAPGAPTSSPLAVAVSSTRQESMPQFSPDGRRVAFFSDRSGASEIWLAAPDGSDAVQLTSMGAVASGYPHWSPDGERIVFQSNLEGQWDVYMIQATGGKPQNVTSHPASDYFPSFSRDGRWIYFNSNRTGEHHIWKIPASGGHAVQLTNTVGYAPLESPDGAWIYYVQTLDRPSPLWRVPVSGGVPVRVLEGVIMASFVVLERGIYYIDRPSRETRLQYFDFETRKSTLVAHNLGDVQPYLTASSDGRTILYSRTDASVDDLMLVENFR
jgi:Tol biopolymer transport system component